MKIVVCSLLLLAPLVDAESWPAFLGRDAQGIESGSLPLNWSPQENVAWEVAIPGYGQSSPVVWEDAVYVTSVSGPNKETYHITSVQVDDGGRRWSVEMENSVPVKSSLYVSRAAPTPVVDADGVIALMESGDIIALTHAGEERWRRNLAETFGPFVNEFGLGASPCQTSDHVFVLLEHDGPSHLVALEKASGEVVWQREREPRRSWSSPAIIKVEGEPQVVISSAGSVDGYDIATGELLWSFTDVGGNTATTPIDAGQGRFLIAASPGRQGERAREAPRSNAMMQVRSTDGGYQAERLWIAEKATPSWASPIVHRGYAYWVNRTGVVYCFDAATGENVYTKRAGQSCWATPLGAGERIYFFGKGGETTVLASGPKFEVLAENVLFDPEQYSDPAAAAQETDERRRQAAAMFSGPTVYGYAVAGDRLLIRIGQRLFCVAD
jgi:outer membrane protein assembly factor BamB